MPQLASVLRDRQEDPRPGLLFEADRFSYAELWRAVATTAERLSAQGVGAGSKVVVALPNVPGFVIALMALSELSAVAIPLNPSLPEKERSRILGVAQPLYVVGIQGHVRLMPGVYLSRSHHAAAPVEPELCDAATIVFTSGTTGEPKGVVMTAEALLLNADAVVEYLALGPDDRTLIFLPLFYSYSLSQLISTWRAGGTVVLMKNLLFPAEAVRLIDRHGVTVLGGVPTSLTLLANQACCPGRSLRYLMSAGGPLPPALVRKLDRVFPGVALVNNYGCTEIGPRATSVNYTEYPERIGSIGRAIPNVTVRLIRPDLSEALPMETAEIVLSGPTLMKGYYRNADATRTRMSRWGFHTGDFAYADHEGFLFYQGRHDDVFKCGGEKVSAREIEDVILEHEGVLEVAVVAHPDPVLGHVSVAYVVRAADGTTTEKDLQLFCRRKLSIHKVPRVIHFLERLERTANGKVQKFRLKEATA